MATAEEVVSLIQKEKGVGRGDAIALLRDAVEQDDPQISKIEDVDQFLERETGVGPSLQRMAAVAMSSFERPVTGVLGAIGSTESLSGGIPGMLEDYVQGPADELVGQQVPSASKLKDIPVAGAAAEYFGVGEAPLSDVGGAALGELPAYATATKALSYPARLLAGPLTGVSPRVVAGLMNPGTKVMGDVLSKNAGRMAVAERVVAPVLEQAGAGALVEGASGRDPLTGAAVGALFGVMGIAGGKALSKLRGNQEVSKALEYVARMRHKSKDQVLLETETWGALQEELAFFRRSGETVPQLDPFHALTPEEISQASVSMQPLHGRPMEGAGPQRLGGAGDVVPPQVPGAVRGTSAAPLEGIQGQKPPLLQAAAQSQTIPEGSPSAYTTEGTPDFLLDAEELYRRRQLRSEGQAGKVAVDYAPEVRAPLRGEDGRYSASAQKAVRLEQKRSPYAEAPSIEEVEAGRFNVLTDEPVLQAGDIQPFPEGGRFTADTQAGSDQAVAFFDGYGPRDSRGYIVERKVRGGLVYEAHVNSGGSLGTFVTPRAAGRALEREFPADAHTEGFINQKVELGKRTVEVTRQARRDLGRELKGESVLAREPEPLRRLLKPTELPPELVQDLSAGKGSPFLTGQEGPLHVGENVAFEGFHGTRSPKVKLRTEPFHFGDYDTATTALGYRYSADEPSFGPDARMVPVSARFKKTLGTVEHPLTDAQQDLIDPHYTSGASRVKELQDAGFDGVIYRNSVEGEGERISAMSLKPKENLRFKAVQLFNRLAKDESGAVKLPSTRQVGEKPTNPFAAPVAVTIGGKTIAIKSRPATPRGGTPLRPDEILGGIDIDPEGVIGASPAAREFVNEVGREAGHFGSEYISRPVAIFARDPLTHEFYNRAVDIKRRRVFREGTTLIRRTEKILESVGALKPGPTFNKFVEAVQGLERQADGSLVQKGTVTPAMDKAARQWRSKSDRIYQILTGVDARVPAILRDLGLKGDENTLRTLRAMQEGEMPRRIDPAMELAMHRTVGMLNWDARHDLSLAFDEGYWSFLPLPNERARLIETVQSLEKQVAAFGGRSTPQVDLMKQEIGQRLARLQAIEDRTAKKRPAARVEGHIPKYEKGQPYAVPKEVAPEGALFEQDPRVTTRRYINEAMNAAYMNEVLAMMREINPHIQNDSLRQFAFKWINAQRGVRGLERDEAITRSVNAYRKWRGKTDITVGDLRRRVADIMTVRAMMTLFVQPTRFALVNASQPFLTTYPLVSTSSFSKAWARMLVNPKKVLREAQLAGVIGDSDVYLLTEAITDSRMLKRAADVMGSPARWTEKINRVHAYTAGKLEASRPNFQPNSKVKTYLKPKDPKMVPMAYGKALVDISQFMLGQEGKPVAFTGSSLARGAGQFKTFGVYYTGLFKDAIKDAGKDPKTAGKMLAALLALGGVPTLPIVGNLLRSIRKEAYRQHADHLAEMLPDPNTSGIGWTLMALGLEPGELPIDVTQAVQPFNFPQSAADVLPWALGPTEGLPFSLGPRVEEAGGWTSPGGANVALRGLVPPIAALGEGLTEMARGGVATPAGRPLTNENRPFSHTLARTLNLRPGVKYERGDYLVRIRDLYEAGRPELVPEVVRAAEEAGFVVDRKTVAGIKGSVKTDATRSTWDSVADIFGGGG